MRNDIGARPFAIAVLRALVLLALTWGYAAAQGVDEEPVQDSPQGSAELSLYGGGYFGGTVYAGENGGGAVRDVQVGDDWTYGARLGYVFNRSIGLELGYGRSASGLKVESGAGFQATSIGDLTEDRYELNLNFYLRPGPMRGFFSIGGGATHFGADFDDGSGSPRSASDTRFTSNLGLGFQYSASEKMGLRIDGRWRYTDTNTGGSDYYCDIYGFCYEYDNSSYTSAELTAGLVYTIR
jgi:hypothetical protein